MMKFNSILFISIFLPATSFSQTQQFDNDWRFHKGGVQGAESPGFDDDDWRIVDLPHDWSIEDIPGIGSPFDHNATSQVGGGYTVGGTGWYRKTFTLPEENNHKHIYLQFDGIYMNPDFWLNGEYLGNHHYGYTSFWFDITGKIKFGEKNVLSVEVKNEGRNSRWYSGSGIYRHVWLRLADPVHIAQWGISITTPEINSSTAKINIKTNVNNNSPESANIKLVTRILDSRGSDIVKNESTIHFAPGEAHEFEQSVILKDPSLWAIDSPVLYTAHSELYCDNKLTDQADTKFGIRTIRFDAVNGFLLNGKSLKLKGGCVHHDNGPLGAKAYDRAEERRVELLKASGFNAIRCSHNPPSPAFLDACDQLGVVVIDEAFDMWRLPKNPYDYHLYFDESWKDDVESWIKRDRNHPSVILWSIGNEIRDMEKPEVITIEKMLAGEVRRIDPTRPVTAAANNLRPEKDTFFSNLDVCGYNYAAGGDHKKEDIYLLDHRRVPNRIMFGSESYALEAFEAWMPVLDYTFVIGDFVWTAFDYIGEASIGWRGYWQEDFFPWNLAYCGDIDICGWKRPQSFYRDALWKENQLSIFVTPPVPTFPLNPNIQSWSKWGWYDVLSDWTWPGYENRKFKVIVYSSCTHTELFLNGKSLGKRETGRATKFMAEWEVPYAAGELKAVGYNGLKIISTSVLKTAGNVETIKLLPDRSEIKADHQDLSYITIELTDKNGVRHPKADNMIRFKVEGEGSIAGVGNANPTSIESFQQPNRKAWQGRCLVVIKSTGKPGIIKLTVEMDGLSPSVVNITTK